MRQLVFTAVLGTALAVVMSVGVENVVQAVGRYAEDAVTAVVAAGPFFDHGG